MLIFITGTSTSGKSTIALKLAERGYNAFDTEHNGISAWYNKQTGIMAAEFGEIPDRSPEWLSRHHWQMSKDRIVEIAEQYKGQTVFLCGGANEPEIRVMCQKVIWLKTDEETIRQRVTQPRDHDFGTRPHELARAIERNITKEAEYRAYGADIVDARQPIDRVVDELLSLSAGWYSSKAL